MDRSRLEVFTDGLIAIIITITVLEIRVPQGSDLASLRENVAILLAYALAYVNVGIFWNNHHHVMQATERINGKILWANLSLLFFLSLVLFVIRWIDEQGFAVLPTAAYGVVLFLADVSWEILERQIIAYNGRDSRLALALGNNLKGKLSLALCLVAIGLALVHPWLAIVTCVVVVLMWLVPDPCLESRVVAGAGFSNIRRKRAFRRRAA